MRRLLTLSLAVFAASAMAQQTHPPDPAASGQPQTAQVDPKGQCEWIAKGKPEMAPLEKACEAAVEGWETLPNFVCDMNMLRREPRERPEKITAELRFIEGKEEFSSFSINGNPVDRLPGNGSWTTGAFAPPGLTVLDGRSAPKFTFRGEEKAPDGAALLVFDYTVAKASNQSWTWSIPPYQYRPGFHGSLIIHQPTGELRSVSLVADDIDVYVPTLSMSETTEYNRVRVGDLGEFLLPVHSQMKSCYRFSPGCAEISRDFVNCRRFAGKARIIE